MLLLIALSIEMVDNAIGGGNKADYDRCLRLLESLITGKKRQDGTQWEHAFDMMQCYLEVCWYYMSIFGH